jgi:large subunit ribosomal protein L36
VSSALRKVLAARSVVVHMKVRNSLKWLKRQPGSAVVRRRGRTFVVNKRNPRWKGRQG